MTSIKPSPKTRSWDEHKYKLLKDPKVAQAYIEGAVEEGVPLNYAIGEVIKAQGVTKVSQRAEMALPNVLRATRKDANPTFSTLTKLLHALGLELSVRRLPRLASKAKA
jgi:probable addiction module antidote protein